MELILLNLKLARAARAPRPHQPAPYCELAARAVGMPIPINYPARGRDAFRTATGVHAAAIIKAQNKGDAWLADRIYSGVPAGMFGRKQEICIGYMSGASNVSYWLRTRGIGVYVYSARKSQGYWARVASLDASVSVAEGCGVADVRSTAQGSVRANPCCFIV
jgi:isopropylmalate/homocitrate/citramalate synthase